MTAPWTIRPGKPRESSDIAILADSAARRMASAFWAVDALPGQSWIEIGRTRILSNEATNLYHANWQVYEMDGHLAAGYCGFSIPDPYVPDRVPDVPDSLCPCWKWNRPHRAVGCCNILPSFPNSGGGELAGYCWTMPAKQPGQPGHPGSCWKSKLRTPTQSNFTAARALPNGSVGPSFPSPAPMTAATGS